MGRTVLPFSQVLEREYEEWKKFRRALRKEDQETFDRLFDRASCMCKPQLTLPVPGPWNPSSSPSAWNTKNSLWRSWKS